MKNLVIIPLLVVFSSFNSFTPIQEVPNRVRVEAEKLTDKQIDSVYKNVHITPYIDATRNEFNALRTHMDSLNAINILREKQIELDAIRRDSMTHSYLVLLIENERLKNENANQYRQIEIIKQAPNILFAFMLFLLAFFIGVGVRRGVKGVFNKDKNSHA